jgi:signal transduction histidine kinase
MGFLAKLWNWISFLGISHSTGDPYSLKRFVLTNRINFVLFILGQFSFLMLLLFSPVDNSGFSFNEYRILLCSAVAGLSLLLAWAGANKLSRISLIFMPVFILSILPIFLGTVNDESYLDYPWFIITSSITPHFVLSPKENRTFYFCSLLYYLLLLLPLEQILRLFNNPEVKLLPVIEGNYLYMKLTQVSIYGFLNLSIIYLQSLSRQHESNLEIANEQLHQQSVIITRQSEELIARNELLLRQQIELKGYNKELEKQNHELEVTLSELRETQAQLIQAEKLATIGMLTAGIAHEINNPINYINSGLEGLKVSFNDCYNYIEESIRIMESDSPDIPRDILRLEEKYDLKSISGSIPVLLANIQNGSLRATEIVRSLLYFTHNSDDKFSPCNLHESIDASLVILNHQMKNCITIIKNYGKIPLVYCYAGKINQVFMNLLSNAVQAIEDTGEIVITTENVEERNSVKIKIRDNGKGINEKIHDKIFDPFFSTKEAGKGTGLGLPIVLKIIKEHGGELTFETSSGSGTEFCVELPVIPLAEKAGK